MTPMPYIAPPPPFVPLATPPAADEPECDCLAAAIERQARDLTRTAEAIAKATRDLDLSTISSAKALTDLVRIGEDLATVLAEVEESGGAADYRY